MKGEKVSHIDDTRERLSGLVGRTITVSLSPAGKRYLGGYRFVAIYEDIVLVGLEWFFIFAINGWRCLVRTGDVVELSEVPVSAEGVVTFCGAEHAAMRPTIAVRIRQLLTQASPQTYVDIANQLDLKLNSVIQTVRRHASLFICVPSADGLTRIGLARPIDTVQ